MKALAELTEREVLALAIASEEEDSRIYQAFAEKCRDSFPASARVFDEMAAEEREHRTVLYENYQQRFGDHLPPIRREDVKGFLRRNTLWMKPDITPEMMRREAELMEMQAANFYDKAASNTLDVSVRKLLMELAEIERSHGDKAHSLEQANITDTTKSAEADAARRLFVLQYVQPGLAGLIDGSVSTLAPIFAAAFATHNNHDTFVVGLAASLGAGISMGFTEALSDDGTITGRGSPWMRGVVCGLMTAIGGLGHTIPYLVPDHWPNAFHIATGIAATIVAIELLVIAWIRTRFMDTPFLRACFSVILGGVLVLLTGILIGSS